jgi:spore maturation protein CgeB
MRFVFLAENYHQMYDHFWEALPQVASVNFATAQEQLFGEFIYQSDSQAAALRALGHEAVTLVPDCIPLQERWAKDHRVWMPPYRKRSPALVNRAWRMLTGLTRRDHWHTRLLSEQLRDILPDVVQVYSGVRMNQTMLSALRPLASRWVCHWSSPIRETYPYTMYDLIVTTAKNFEDAFRVMGCKSHLVQHAFDDRILEKLGPAHPREGVLFVGTLSSHHHHRAAILEAIAQRVPLEVYGEGFDALPAGSALKAAWRGRSMFGLEMYQAFARAKIVLHIPGDIVRVDAGAKRLFEIAGAGAMMLTEAQPGLDTYFEVGHECAAFDTAEDAVEKIEYYIANEEARASMAAAGQHRTLRDHTYRVRMQDWLRAIGV